VTVAAPDVDFAARGIARIEAQLSYDDPGEGLSFNDRFTFTHQRDVNFFEFDYASVGRSSYSCTVVLVLLNGLVQERDLGSLSADKLVLPSA
jgi:hypothetical protein